MFAFSAANSGQIEFDFTAGSDSDTLSPGIVLYATGAGTTPNNACTSPDWPSAADRTVAPGVTIDTIILESFNLGPWSSITLKVAGSSNDVGTYIARVVCDAISLDYNVPISGSVVQASVSPAPSGAFSTSSTNTIKVYLR